MVKVIKQKKESDFDKEFKRITNVKFKSNNRLYINYLEKCISVLIATNIKQSEYINKLLSELEKIGGRLK